MRLESGVHTRIGGHTFSAGESMDMTVPHDFDGSPLCPLSRPWRPHSNALPGIYSLQLRTVCERRYRRLSIGESPFLDRCCENRSARHERSCTVPFIGARA